MGNHWCHMSEEHSCESRSFALQQAVDKSSCKSRGHRKSGERLGDHGTGFLAALGELLIRR